MATVTLLGSTFDTNSGSHTVTATPNVGDLIIIVTAITGSTVTTTPTDNNSDGLGVYTSGGTVLSATSANIMGIYARNSLVAISSSTVFTHAPGTTTGGGLAVYAIRGGGKPGSAAFKQTVATQANHASGSAPAPALGSSPAANNPIITGVQNSTNPPALTAPTSFTRDVNSGYATPTTGITTASIASGGPQTVTWGTSSGSAFGSLAAEIDGTILISVTDSTAVTDLPFYYDDTAIVWENINLKIQSTPNFSVTDSTAVSDVPTLEQISYPSVSNSTAISDIATIEVFSLISVTDSTAVGDSLIVELISYPIVAESTTVSDTPTILIPILLISVSDSTIVTDIPTINLLSYIKVTDTVAVSDAISIQTVDLIEMDGSTWYGTGNVWGLKIIG